MTDEWKELESFITPIINMQESKKLCEEDAAKETAGAIARLKESYLKTSEKFRKPKGKFQLLCQKLMKKVNQHPNVNVYVILQQFRLQLNSYRQQSSEAMGKKKRRDIRNLDMHISKLNKMIRREEEREVDLNDLDDDTSSYLYIDRLKRNLLKCWKKRCALANDQALTGRPIEEKFTYAGSQYSGVNVRVCKHINSRQGLNFPNYQDILNIVRNTNMEDKLKLEPGAVEYEARNVFKQVGANLKKLRQRDYRLCSGSHITDKVMEDYQSDSSNSSNECPTSISQDPALYNNDLKMRLQENRRLGENKMNSLIEDFVKRQEVNVKSECKSDEEEDDEGEACSYSDTSESDEEQNDDDEDGKEVKCEVENDVEDNEHSNTCLGFNGQIKETSSTNENSDSSLSNNMSTPNECDNDGSTYTSTDSSSTTENEIGVKYRNSETNENGVVLEEAVDVPDVSNKTLKLDTKSSEDSITAAQVKELEVESDAEISVFHDNTKIKESLRLPDEYENVNKEKIENIPNDKQTCESNHVLQRQHSSDSDNEDLKVIDVKMKLKTHSSKTGFPKSRINFKRSMAAKSLDEIEKYESFVKRTFEDGEKSNKKRRNEVDEEDDELQILSVEIPGKRIKTASSTSSKAVGATASLQLIGQCDKFHKYLDNRSGSSSKDVCDRRTESIKFPQNSRLINKPCSSKTSQRCSLFNTTNVASKDIFNNFISPSSKSKEVIEID